MALHFANVVKGQITQTMLKTILERAGYRVTPFGIEELVTEIKYIDKEQYDTLDLADALRCLPDLLVADYEMTVAYLVEVKFRRTFNDITCRMIKPFLC